MTRSAKSVNVNLRIPNQTYEYLKLLAESEVRTVSGTITWLIEQQRKQREPAGVSPKGPTVPNGLDFESLALQAKRLKEAGHTWQQIADLFSQAGGKSWTARAVGKLVERYGRD